MKTFPTLFLSLKESQNFLLTKNVPSLPLHYLFQSISLNNSGSHNVIPFPLVSFLICTCIYIFISSTIFEYNWKFNTNTNYVETLVQGEKPWCQYFLLFSYDTKDTKEKIFIGNMDLIQIIKN